MAAKAAKGKEATPEELNLTENDDGTFTNDDTGEIVDQHGKPLSIDEAMFGSADTVTRAHDDGGLTIKKVKLKVGKSIKGIFRGFSPYEYTDKRSGTPRIVILSDVILDVIHPDTGKPLGIVVKLGATARILQDMALATPGDIVAVARLGTSVINGNNMHDDVTRIWPADPKSVVMPLSSRAITDRKALDAFRAGPGRALPAKSTERTSDDDRHDGVGADA